MAVIGTFGRTVFSVSPEQILTFDNLTWESSLNFTKHERHLLPSILEFTGIDTEKLKFDMIFSIYHGIDPLWEIDKLYYYSRFAVPNRLVIGEEFYGLDKWVVTNLSKKMERFGKSGELLFANVSVSLESYPSR